MSTSQKNMKRSSSGDLELNDQLKVIVAKYGVTVRPKPQKIEHAGITVSANVYAVYEAAVIANYFGHVLALDGVEGMLRGVMTGEFIRGIGAIDRHFKPLLHKKTELPFPTAEMVARRTEANEEAANDYIALCNAVIRFDTSIYTKALD